MTSFPLPDRRCSAALAPVRVAVIVVGRSNGIDLPSASRQPKAG